MDSCDVASKQALARKDTRVRMYLITDDGFLQKTIRSVACLVLLLGACYACRPVRLAAVDAYEWIKLQMLVAAHRMAWWSLLGLLSSSCCVIQILLNTLSLGCSGINSLLGPLRPHFIALTMVTNSISLYVAYPFPFQWAPAAAGCGLSVVLTFTPEMLAAYTYRCKLPIDPNRQQELVGKSAIRMQLKTGAMGCISCVSKVRSVMECNKSVLTSSVDFENSLVSAHIHEEPGQVADAVAVALEKALQDSKFPVVFWTVEKLKEAVPNALQGGEVSTGTGKGTARNKESLSAKLWSWTQVVIAGLLGIHYLVYSSCCLIQLVINILTAFNVIQGVGCTGFNKVLGPIRPQLRIVTAVWMAFSWYTATKRGWKKKRLVIHMAVFLCLTFLPEILVVTNSTPVASPTSNVQVLNLRVDGMGCEACQKHVKGVIDQWSGVIESAVDFKAGTAHVHVAKEWVGGKGGFGLEGLKKHLEIDGYNIDEL